MMKCAHEQPEEVAYQRLLRSFGMRRAEQTSRSSFGFKIALMTLCWWTQGLTAASAALKVES
eukprot:1566548-Amphidinium_carterae.1